MPLRFASITLSLLKTIDICDRPYLDLPTCDIDVLKECAQEKKSGLAVNIMKFKGWV